jgi:hypothetical protein
LFRIRVAHHRPADVRAAAPPPFELRAAALPPFELRAADLPLFELHTHLRPLYFNVNHPQGQGLPPFPGMIYMDDLILAATSDIDLQSLYDTTISHCEQWGCVVNQAKTTVAGCNMDETLERFATRNKFDANAVQPVLQYVGIKLCPPLGPASWLAHAKYRGSKTTKAFGFLRSMGFSLRGFHIPAALETTEKILQKILLDSAFLLG